MKPLCYLLAPCLALSLLGPAKAQPVDSAASEKPLKLIDINDRHEMVFHLPKERLASDTPIGRFLVGPYPFMLKMQRARKFYNYSFATLGNPIRPPAGMGWYRHPIIDQCIDSNTVSLRLPPKLGSMSRSQSSAAGLAEILDWKSEFKFYVLADDVATKLGLYASMLDSHTNFCDKPRALKEINNLDSKLADRIQSLEELTPLLPPTFRNHTLHLLAYFKRRYELCLQTRKTLEDPIPHTNIPYSFSFSRNKLPDLMQLRTLLEADLPGKFTYGSSELNRMIEFEIQLENAGAELPDLHSNVKNRAKTASLDSLKIALANLQEIPFDSSDVLKETNFPLSKYRECVDAFEQAQIADIQTPVKYVNLWMEMTAKCLGFEYARSRYREFLLSRL